MKGYNITFSDMSHSHSNHSHPRLPVSFARMGVAARLLIAAGLCAVVWLAILPLVW